MKTLYTTSATATSGREGQVSTDDKVIDLKLSLPKGMGGPGTEGTTNPEQLFAAGYSACFGSAVKFVAGKSKVDASQVKMTAKVAIGLGEDGGMQLEVELIGSAPNLSRDELAGLMDAAHKVCPYSKATRNNVPVKLTVA